MAAWTKRTWTERAGTLLNRFTKSSETTTSVVLENNPGSITQAGTPFTAAAMNNIENGIDSAFKKDYVGEINALTAKTPAAGDVICIEDSGASYAKKKSTLGNESGNVPLSNNVENIGLKSNTARALFNKNSSGTSSILDLAVSDLAVQGTHYYSIPNTDPAAPWAFTSRCLAIGDVTNAKLLAWRYNTKATAVRNRVSGTWDTAWTYLTDDNGNPVSAAYDLIIDSDAKLAAWAAGGSFSRVLIKAGTWTLASGGVNLTAAGTKEIIGETGSLLVFSGAENGFLYNSAPTTNDYRMYGVSVQCSEASGALVNSAFKNCVNLTSCKAIAYHSGGIAAAYGFNNCKNLINCQGSADSQASTSACSGFSGCIGVFGCQGVGTNSGSGAGYGFYGCKKCIGNSPLGASKTATHNTSYADAGTAAAYADTAAGGWNS